MDEVDIISLQKRYNKTTLKTAELADTKTGANAAGNAGKNTVFYEETAWLDDT